MLKGWVPVWVIPAIAALAIGTVWLRLLIVRTSYSINNANQMIRNLQQERDATELKVTALRSPRRLELLAKTKFGLSPPRPEQVIRNAQRSH